MVEKYPEWGPRKEQKYRIFSMKTGKKVCWPDWNQFWRVTVAVPATGSKKTSPSCRAVSLSLELSPSLVTSLSYITLRDGKSCGYPGPPPRRRRRSSSASLESTPSSKTTSACILWWRSWSPWCTATVFSPGTTEKKVMPEFLWESHIVILPLWRLITNLFISPHGYDRFSGTHIKLLHKGNKREH